jgi:hypothetical protein
MDTAPRVNAPKSVGFNLLVYIITIVVVLVFIYFIYQFLYGGPTLKSNLVISDILDAKLSESALSDKAVPTIIEGSDYTVNFWINLNDYNYKSGSRKHILEIGGTNFSTLLVALGATTPTLLVRIHTMGNDQIGDLTANNYGITKCSIGGNDCSGGAMTGFSKITDVNIISRMRDNALTPDIIRNFFQPFTHMDENSLINSDSVCDVKDIDMGTFVNVCLVLSSKTVDIYLQGKLVKTCVFNNYFKVDPTGVSLKILQGTLDNQGNSIPNTAGFGGQFGRLQIFNNALTPDNIYKIYLSGHTGSSNTNDPLAFIKYIFTGTA